MARLARVLGVVSSLALSSVLFASCGSGNVTSLVRRSCVDVKAALVIQHQAEAPGLGASQRSRLEARALARLLKATPTAAAATSQDGSWNVLMTTINEAERVPLANLVQALTRLCQVADSSTPDPGE